MAALLMAVSYHHVWFSQNARGYTELMFWSLIGTGLFIEGMAQPSRRTWFGYACVLAAAGYTHLSGVFFFAVHGLVYLAVSIKRFYSGSRRLDFKPLGGCVL